MWRNLLPVFFELCFRKLGQRITYLKWETHMRDGRNGQLKPYLIESLNLTNLLQKITRAQIGIT